MPQSATFTYDDPMPYQAAIRAGEVEVSVTARGDFRGKLYPDSSIRRKKWLLGSGLWIRL